MPVGSKTAKPDKLLVAASMPLYLFAKAPVAGRAKKRMCPPLDEVQAAKVAAALLKNATAIVEDGWPGQCVLSATPDLSHPAFSKHLQNDRWETQIQPPLDLGARMRDALQAGIRRAGAAAVLGTDIPAINASILQQAHKALSEGRQVVGPSMDGGFYFLGLVSMPDTLFAGIRWGSEKVYVQLLDNAAHLGIDLQPLPVLSDCDYFADLELAMINGRPGLSHI